MAGKRNENPTNIKITDDTIKYFKEHKDKISNETLDIIISALNVSIAIEQNRKRSTKKRNPYIEYIKLLREYERCFTLKQLYAIKNELQDIAIDRMFPCDNIDSKIDNADEIEF